jgi:L-fuconolactonase
MRVDAHQHFWKVERGDYGWLTPDLGVLYRDYLPADLQPHLDALKVDKTVLVQAAPTVEETDFLLDLYDETPFVAGVVGWLDLESPQFPEQLERYRQRPGFLGVRPMLQDLPDDRWILRPQVLENLTCLAAAELPLDLLVKPRHLPVVLELLESLPELRAVVDHAAKPFIAQGLLEPWREQMSRIAAFPRVMCKLSGLITEADHQNWQTDHLRPYVHHAVQAFGADRVMFGSDWPVCLLAGSYRDVHDALVKALPDGLSAAEWEAVFGENAVRFYRLHQERER